VQSGRIKLTCAAICASSVLSLGATTLPAGADVTRVSGTWRLERAEPNDDKGPRTLTIDATARVVIVTATEFGGASGMRSTVQRYALDGIERAIEGEGQAVVTRRCRRLEDADGFEILESVAHDAGAVRTVTRSVQRYTLSNRGRLIVESRKESSPREALTRRIYVRR
jgi:hypothetical protein